MIYKLFEEYTEGVYFWDMVPYNNIDEIIDVVAPEFNNDKEFAKDEVVWYLNNLEELYNTGGEVYRLIFLENKLDLDEEDFGDSWVMDKGYYTRLYPNLSSDRSELEEPYLITAFIRKGKVDIKESIDAFVILPQEGEIRLKKNPQVYRIEKYERDVNYE